jgi:hypothetical protein
LSDQPSTCPRRFQCQNESEQCTAACLIPIWGREPSAGPCSEGVDCLKTSGLLRNRWTPLPDRPNTYQGELRVKMSQGSVLEHV